MGRTLIEVKAVNKVYATHHVWKDISFSIESGKICELIGEGGTGKTTLIRVL